MLKFLHELCSLYERDYLQKSSLQTEILKAFIEKVSDLADVHKLASRNYHALVMESSLADLQNHLNKVSFFMPLSKLLQFFLLCTLEASQILIIVNFSTH